MSKQLEIIKQVVIEAGELALSYQQDIPNLDIREKGFSDFVSQADTECEQLIKEKLNEHFEGFSFLAEESGVEDNDSDYRWIIDPIDGTTNYLNGLNLYACAVCLQEKGETIASVVYLPALDELYYASRDKAGAFLEFPNSSDEKVIKLDCSKKTTLASSLISYVLWGKNFEKCISIMKKLTPYSSGSASLCYGCGDITNVARGQYGALIATSLKKWDLFPAGYIAQKAGAEIYTLQGRPISEIENYDPESDGCIVCNKSIIEEIIELTKPTMEIAGERAREVYEEKICPLANKAVETSTPYVKEACKKSGPYVEKAKDISKKGLKQVKPYSKKAWAFSVKTYYKTKPHVIRGSIWTKNKTISLCRKIKDKIKK